MRRLALLPLLALAACGVVRRHSVRPDYAAADRMQTLRLVVVVAPLPGGDPALGALFGRIARKYANDKRDFIVKAATAAEARPQGACGEGVEGLLELAPEARREGAGVQASVAAKLVRCRDGETVWSAEAGGSWPSEDPLYVDTARVYAEALGEGVRPFVGPVFRLLQATLDTLPEPAMPDDAAKLEKIDLDD